MIAMTQHGATIVLSGRFVIEGGAAEISGAC